MAECNSCGGFVSDDYARVFGNNEGKLFDCRSCRGRSDPDEESDEPDDERVVLLREVAGDDESDQTDVSAATDTAATGATDTAATGATDTDVSGASVEAATGADAGDATDVPGDDAEKSTRSRIAGLFSSLRG